MAQGPKSRFNIEVTAADIEKAKVNDSFNCVVAQAIARQVPNASRIEIDLQTIRWSDDNGRHVFLTPYSAAGYIVAYDAGDDIHPFRFQLRDPIQAAQKRAKTRAAKQAVASRSKVNTERRKQRDAEAVLADPSSPPDRVAAAQQRVKEAPARIKAAEVAHQELTAAYKAAGESISEERITETARKAAPKVSKTKTRVYGQRVYRVNQAEGRTHYAGRPESKQAGY